VIRNDQRCAVGDLQRLEYLAEAAIDGFNGFRDRGDNPGVSDHVSVREIHHNELVGAAFDGIHNSGADPGGAHLGLKVVRCDLR
jgi:hypothetical protein